MFARDQIHLFPTTDPTDSYHQPVIRTPRIDACEKNSPPEPAVWGLVEIVVIHSILRRNGQRPDVEKRWTSPAEPGSVLGLAVASPESQTKQGGGDTRDVPKQEVADDFGRNLSDCHICVIGSRGRSNASHSGCLRS